MIVRNLFYTAPYINLKRTDDDVDDGVVDERIARSTERRSRHRQSVVAWHGQDQTNEDANKYVSGIQGAKKNLSKTVTFRKMVNGLKY